MTGDRLLTRDFNLLVVAHLLQAVGWSSMLLLPLYLSALGGTRDVGAGSIRVTNPSGWDSGITRSVTASANDSTASGAFDAIVTALPDGVTGATGIIGPMY